MLKRSFEWYTSNTKIAYPFVNQVEVGASIPLSDLIVDAYFVYDGVAKNIKLDTLGHPVNDKSVIISYDDDTVALIGTDCLTTTFGDWRLNEWQSSDKVFRLLFKENLISSFTWPVTPTDAYFVDHILQPRPKRVTNIVNDMVSVNGNVEIVEGNNISLTPSTVVSSTYPTRGTKRIKIDCEGGNGAGKYDSCNDYDPAIYTINGTGPDTNGDFKLYGVDCYRSEVPVVSVPELIDGMTALINASDKVSADLEAMRASLGDTGLGPPWYRVPNTLQLLNECQPCCDCQDYVFVYDSVLRNLLNNARTASNNIYAVRDKLIELVDKINSEKICRDGYSLFAYLIPRNGWTYSVVVNVENNTDCPVTVTIGISGTGMAVPGSTYRMADTAEGGLIPSALSATLKAAKSTTFVVQYYVGPTSNMSVASSIIANFGGSILSANKTTTLIGPFNK